MNTFNSEFHRQVFYGARDALVVVDRRQGGVVEANDPAAELLGFARDQIVGKNFLDLFPAAQRETTRDVIEGMWAAGGGGDTVCQLMSTRGTLVDTILTSHVVAHGDEMYLVVAMRSTTAQTCAVADLKARNAELEELAAARAAELQRANAELQQAVQEANRNAEQAHEATRAKSRFVANLTHELRTPLNALIGMSTLLTEMELAEEPRQAAEIVADSAQGLLGLVNDVLDFAKIEAGKMELRREPFELEKTLLGVRNTFALLVREKGLRYSLELDRKIPQWLVGDEGRLRQILINLVGNALKFTEEGGVTIAVVQKAVSGHQVKLDFSVTDTGCGIAEADQQHLFEAFTQVENTDGRHISGTGLGLNISRQLVEKMGGRFHVASTEGWGSTFGFTVQMEVGEAPAENEPPVLVREKRATTEQRKSAFNQTPSELMILLADDNKVNQIVALGMLRKLGFDGVPADNGRHALELLAEGDFDLVFMDLQMPEMGGLDATRAIRAGQAGQQNRDIPIIAMTGHASRKDRQICLDAGMNGYVTKPISSDRILESIQDLSRTSNETAGRSEPFSLAKLVSQMNGDTELAAEILEIFREDTAERLQRVVVALRNGQYSKTADEAVAIATGAVNVCASELIELADELERAALNQEQEYASSLADEMVTELARMLQDV